MSDSRVRVHLTAWRTDRGLSQRELARASGVRQATISDLEAGKATAIRFTTLGALAAVLGCEPWELLREPPR